MQLSKRKEAPEFRGNERKKKKEKIFQDLCMCVCVCVCVYLYCQRTVKWTQMLH